MWKNFRQKMNRHRHAAWDDSYVCTPPWVLSQHRCRLPQKLHTSKEGTWTKAAGSTRTQLYPDSRARSYPVCLHGIVSSVLLWRDRKWSCWIELLHNKGCGGQMWFNSLSSPGMEGVWNGYLIDCIPHRGGPRRKVIDRMNSENLPSITTTNHALLIYGIIWAFVCPICQLWMIKRPSKFKLILRITTNYYESSITFPQWPQTCPIFYG